MKVFLELFTFRVVEFNDDIFIYQLVIYFKKHESISLALFTFTVVNFNDEMLAARHNGLFAYVWV